jgi:hypothetical protein
MPVETAFDAGPAQLMMTREGQDALVPCCPMGLRGVLNGPLTMRGWQGHAPGLLRSQAIWRVFPEALSASMSKAGSIPGVSRARPVAATMSCCEAVRVIKPDAGAPAEA